MFSVRCPRHGAEVLLSSTNIEALHNTEAGIVVHWRCRCGARGVQVTGVSAPSGPAMRGTANANADVTAGADVTGTRRPGTAA